MTNMLRYGARSLTLAFAPFRRWRLGYKTEQLFCIREAFEERTTQMIAEPANKFGVRLSFMLCQCALRTLPYTKKAKDVLHLSPAAPLGYLDSNQE